MNLREKWTIAYFYLPQRRLHEWKENEYRRMILNHEYTGGRFKALPLRAALDFVAIEDFMRAKNLRFNFDYRLVDMHLENRMSGSIKSNGQ